MAERKAVNKYYPPDWNPSKGSLNKHVGQHPLRDRARKLSEGILIIRFELPFNIWCLGCERHLARGVRFNAEKKEIGKYHSTSILSFRMKCPSCPQWIEIHTDPAEGEYVVVSGARRKQESWTAEDLELSTGLSQADRDKMASNSFFRLEHEARDQRSVAEKLPRIQALQNAKDALFKDDWSASQRARSQFRLNKQAHQGQVKIADDIRKRGSFSIKLLPEHQDDVDVAKSIDFTQKSREEAVKRQKLLKDLKDVDHLKPQKGKQRQELVLKKKDSK